MDSKKLNQYADYLEKYITGSADEIISINGANSRTFAGDRAYVINNISSYNYSGLYKKDIIYDISSIVKYKDEYWINVINNNINNIPGPKSQYWKPFAPGLFTQTYEKLTDLPKVGIFLHQSVNVLGRSIPQDGGEGLWIWNGQQHKSFANGGTIYDPEQSLNTQGKGHGTGCWERLFSGAINAKWFGLVSDGNKRTNFGTDNVQAFNNAIVSAISANKSLYIPSGNFYISKGLDIITNSVNIFGAGVEKTKIIINHDFNGIVFEFKSKTWLTESNRINRITISNFTLLGFSQKGYTHCVGMKFCGCSYVYSDNLFFRHIGKETLLLESVWDSVFYNLTVNACGGYDASHPLRLIDEPGNKEPSNGVRFISPHFEANVLGCISIEGKSHQIRFTGGRFEGNGKLGKHQQNWIITGHNTFDCGFSDNSFVKGTNKNNPGKEYILELDGRNHRVSNNNFLAPTINDGSNILYTKSNGINTALHNVTGNTFAVRKITKGDLLSKNDFPIHPIHLESTQFVGNVVRAYNSNKEGVIFIGGKGIRKSIVHSNSIQAYLPHASSLCFVLENEDQVEQNNILINFDLNKYYFNQKNKKDILIDHVKFIAIYNDTYNIAIKGNSYVFEWVSTLPDENGLINKHFFCAPQTGIYNFSLIIKIDFLVPGENIVIATNYSGLNNKIELINQKISNITEVFSINFMLKMKLEEKLSIELSLFNENNKISIIKNNTYWSGYLLS